MKQWIDQLKVNWPNQTAIYAIQKSAYEPCLSDSSNAGRVRFRQNSGKCFGTERAHPAEFNLSLGDSTRLLERGGARIGPAILRAIASA
jgi:hypothetical protein